ncbi:hypothetical protein [Sphingopyxis sp. DBS4]|uniref:hypothetical protein n=1 Tax=Sphingopyxis sp. DBS4 TaxID=2968500 RepID=UPI00214BBD6A|nr:hypothetical protein [Sphingopyxis sp. DBS4]
MKKIVRNPVILLFMTRDEIEWEVALAAKEIRRVGLFVDWNSQIKSTPKELIGNPVEQCRHALRATGKKAAKLLCELENDTLFRVRIRLYHGWTSGVTQTTNRLAFRGIDEMHSPDELFPSSRVMAWSDVEFGDRLIDALPERETGRLRIHLPNTLRKQNGDAHPVEKMVDTALAADMLAWARQEPSSIMLIFSPDDDMVPPAYVAESWMKPYGGSLHLVRPPARAESKFLSLEGLLL